jgi:hypothetical protein
MDMDICNFGAVSLQHCNYSSLQVYLELPDILTESKNERLFHKSPEILLFLFQPVHPHFANSNALNLITSLALPLTLTLSSAGRGG